MLASVAALIGVGVILALATRVEVGITRFLFSHSDEALLFTIIGLAIVGAGVAEVVQISAAVGALIVGIAMSGPGIDHARRLIEPLRDFFAALFFALFGLSIDPSQLPPVLVTAGLLAAITGLTKVIGGARIAKRAGLGRTGQLRAGTLLVARGEFSIVIAVIATNSGLDFVGPLAAAYVLILAVLGPLIVRGVEAVTSRDHPAAV
jgi:CPA2 family monovalent cation:H+ antiporter-2